MWSLIHHVVPYCRVASTYCRVASTYCRVARTTLFAVWSLIHHVASTTLLPCGQYHLIHHVVPPYLPCRTLSTVWSVPYSPCGSPSPYPLCGTLFAMSVPYCRVVSGISCISYHTPYVICHTIWFPVYPCIFCWFPAYCAMYLQMCLSGGILLLPALRVSCRTRTVYFLSVGCRGLVYPLQILCTGFLLFTA